MNACAPALHYPLFRLSSRLSFCTSIVERHYRGRARLRVLISHVTISSSTINNLVDQRSALGAPRHRRLIGKFYSLVLSLCDAEARRYMSISIIPIRMANLFCLLH